MRNVHYQCNNPYLGLASFEAIKEDTLYFLELPTHVFVGKFCPVYENVKETTLPVVRAKILGGAFVFEGGRNLWVSLHTKERTDEQTFIDMVIGAFKTLGLDITVQSNDFIYEDKQIGMYAPAEKTAYGYFISAQFTFNSDFDLIENTLIFPQVKWTDKPVENIREWLNPLSNYDITIPQVIDALSTNEMSGFTQEEVADMTSRRGIYEQKSWLEYGTYE